MKEYTIYINNSLSDTGIDVHLNNTLTECDVVVYSIPYREYTTLQNRLEIDSAIHKVVMESFTSVDTAIRVESAIKELLMRAYTHVNHQIEIGTESKLGEVKFALPESTTMELTSDIKKFDVLLPIKINKTLEINDEFDFDLHMSIPIDTAKIEIDSNSLNTNATSYLNVEAPLHPTSQVTLGETKSLVINDVVMEIELNADFLVFRCDYCEPSEAPICIDSHVDLIYIYARKLSEVDEYTLGEIDNTTLEDLDIVVVDE